ncbi:hypothetical protein NQ176_g8521 [Zarea fungicola]|uniref:Uncharacterized protein n=1 Tax=Zarea fungicola TaxID=93591 RepID=A0ACC1MRS9_9HYPO|nr:hypothetical protein NQ176_g8521 [Lecanicillium fungicola]
MPSKRKSPEDKDEPESAITASRRVSRRFPQSGSSRSDTGLSPPETPMEKPKAERVEEPASVQAISQANETLISSCTGPDPESHTSGEQSYAGASAHLKTDVSSVPQSHVAGGDSECPPPAAAAFHDAGEQCPRVAFRVIRTRPIVEEFAWRPESAFMNLTFEEFTNQLPLSLDHDAKGFVFDLVSASAPFRGRIPRDDAMAT